MASASAPCRLLAVWDMGNRGKGHASTRELRHAWEGKPVTVRTLRERARVRTDATSTDSAGTR